MVVFVFCVFLLICMLFYVHGFLFLFSIVFLVFPLEPAELYSGVPKALVNGVPKTLVNGFPKPRDKANRTGLLRGGPGGGFRGFRDFRGFRGFVPFSLVCSLHFCIFLYRGAPQPPSSTYHTLLLGATKDTLQGGQRRGAHHIPGFKNMYFSQLFIDMRFYFFVCFWQRATSVNMTGST